MDATFEVLEINFRFKPNWTEVDVVCGPVSDGTLGIQGKHTKVFPPERSALDILQNEIKNMDYLLW